MTADGKPVTVTDLNTLLATIRNAGVGRDAVVVTIAGENGEDPVSVRIETHRMFTPAPRVDGARPERMAPVLSLGRRATDPGLVEGQSVYGGQLDAVRLISDRVRQDTDHIGRGTWTGA